MVSQAAGKIFLSSSRTSSAASGKAREGLREGRGRLPCGAAPGRVGSVLQEKAIKSKGGWRKGGLTQPLSMGTWLRIRLLTQFLHVAFVAGGDVLRPLI